MSENRPNVVVSHHFAWGCVAKWQHALALVLVSAIVTPAAAEHWMFRPSYFSHTVAPPDRPIPSTRSSYRVPTVGNNPGFSVRGETRINFLRFRNGNSNDVRIQYRSNLELDP